jgi:hypothetical protein
MRAVLTTQVHPYPTNDLMLIIEVRQPRTHSRSRTTTKDPQRQHPRRWHSLQPYNEYFGYVTQGGDLETNYTGLKVVSGRKVALVFSPAIGNITTSSKFRCLKLQRLFCGCTKTKLQATLNVTLACGVTVDAFGLNGEPIGSQVLQYNPNDRVLADMRDFTIALPAANTIRFTGSILDGTPASLTLKIFCIRFPSFPR